MIGRSSGSDTESEAGAERAVPAPVRIGGMTVRALQLATAALMAAAAAYLVVSLVEAVGASTATLPLDVGRGGISLDLPSGARAVGGVADVEVETALGLRLAWWLVTDGQLLAGLLLLEQVRRLLGTTDDPFVEANARRLRVMTAVVIAYVAFGLVRSVVSMAVQASADFDELSTSFDLSPLAIAVALGVLGEMWRRGIELRAEQRLTI